MNIFESRASILVNPTNGVGAWKAGLAKQFGERYPGLIKPYQEACQRGEQRPGHLFFWQAPDDTIICCLPTKRHWRDQARLDDVDLGLKALGQIQKRHQLTVALPPVGCGLGGLRWEEVHLRVLAYLDLRLTDLVGRNPE